MHSTVLMWALLPSLPRATSGSTKITFYSELKAGFCYGTVPRMVARLRVWRVYRPFCLNTLPWCRSATHPPQPTGCGFSGSFPCFLLHLSCLF
ncbi:hypothetical protein P171DRAFT_205450 [Karstenula rhodostoma CBS 690.94]|uniref:Secreted protein n=1 Tax=Karstenula rhodostoma CBS 690.94 TaxID=1392251 RepID=A0A9P4PTH1_9PLEO|nr:hypothetical protein P171DRAFT_205450 [Karstenula rhodostoma CBS 690.94]